jgi:hypothetical protein
VLPFASLIGLSKRLDQDTTPLHLGNRDSSRARRIRSAFAAATDRAIVPAMISFVFSLDEDATPLQEALIQSGLEARFPELTFLYDAELLEGYENTIMPIAGEAHPIEPDRIVLTPIAPALVAEVREAFDELVRQARVARPN